MARYHEKPLYRVTDGADRIFGVTDSVGQRSAVLPPWRTERSISVVHERLWASGNAGTLADDLGCGRCL